MTPADAAKILTLVSTYDNRTFNELTAAAWADALDGLERDDCVEAVRRYFQQSTEWLMPAKVRELVRPILKARREAELAQRIEIESGKPDPETVAARADAIRQTVAAANQLPADESPHPKHDAKLELRARQIPCPWCGAAAGDACTNTATKRRSLTTHAKRLEAVLEAVS